MLLYRPLIIDWLPVSLPHPSHQTTGSSTTFTHSVSVSLSHCLSLHPPCLAFLLIMFPSLPISFSVSFLSLLLCSCAGLRSLMYDYSLLLVKYEWCTCKCTSSLLITHLSNAEEHCPAGLALPLLIGAAFDVAL